MELSENRGCLRLCELSHYNPVKKFCIHPFGGVQTIIPDMIFKEYACELPIKLTLEPLDVPKTPYL